MDGGRLFPAFALFFVAFFMLMKSGQAITCYECNSKDFPDCESEEKLKGHSAEDLKERNVTVNCDVRYEGDGSTYTKCRKIDQDLDGDTRVVRQCATGGPNECTQRAGTYRVKLFYCHCTGDLCNSAVPLTAGTFFMLIMAFLCTVL